MNIDLVLVIIVLLPSILYFPFLLVIIVLLPFRILYGLLTCIYNFDVEKLCHSKFCKKLKQLWKTAWKMAKQPQTILSVYKDLIMHLTEKNRKESTVDMAEIFIVDGNPDQKKTYKIKFQRSIYFTLMLFYSSVLTVAFWPRLVFFYQCCYGGFDINLFLYSLITLPYLFGYLLVFVPCCFMYISISSANHLTVAEAANYLARSPECLCWLAVDCYHIEETCTDDATVTTFHTPIRVPVAKWLDRGNISQDEITFDLNKLLSTRNFIKLSPVLQVSPADVENKKQLEEFRENCIAKHKHRDTNISATFIYKMMRHGNQVDTLVVFKEGTNVPKYQLSKKDFFFLSLFLVVGIPFAGMKNIFKSDTFISCSCFDYALENQGLEDNRQKTYFY